MMQIVITTVESDEQARDLARSLVSRGVAACVQILPIRSHYVWEGEPHEADERLLLVKTLDAPAATELIETLHPYQVPEIVTIEAANVNASYFDWVRGVQSIE